MRADKDAGLTCSSPGKHCRPRGENNILSCSHLTPNIGQLQRYLPFPLQQVKSSSHYLPPPVQAVCSSRCCRERLQVTWVAADCSIVSLQASHPLQHHTPHSSMAKASEAELKEVRQPNNQEK